MVKQTKKAKKNLKITKERILLPVAIIVIVVALVAVTVWKVVPQFVAEQRKAQITAVYDSFKLGNDYILQTQDVFGDKRVYDWDKSRSYSSEKTYIRAANVASTITDLQTRAKNAGFTEIDHPYPHQWQYKSKDNVYVRFNVTSKVRDDYFQNQILMGKDANDPAYDDMNAGPSNVTLKVNLDDNNE